MTTLDDEESFVSLRLHQFSYRTKPLSPFISKLRFLLSCRKHEHAIHWSGDGRSIIITDVDIFRNSVLLNQTEMFKTRNFTSFVRQLNLYGFRKVPSNGRGVCGSNMRFEHAHFRRDRPELMQFVQRSCFSTAKKKNADSTLIATTTCAEPRLLPKTKTNTPKVLQVKDPNIQNSVNIQNININSSHNQIGPFILKSLKSNNGSFPIPTRSPYQTVFAPSRQYLLSTETTTVASAERIKNISLNDILKVGKPTEKVNEKPCEHNYAYIPTASSIVEVTSQSQLTSPSRREDNDVYEFLNENFRAEKEVVQSLLSLPTSQSDLQSFSDLKFLAEVSTNNVSCDFEKFDV